MNLINKNIFLNKNDQEKSFMAIKDREDQNIEIFLKKIIKDLIKIKGKTKINTLNNKKLFSVRQMFQSLQRNFTSLDRAKRDFGLPGVNSNKIAVVLLSEKPTAQIKVKKLVNFLISLLGDVRMLGVSNITRWVSSRACFVISNATRDIHNFVGISSSFIFNNKIKQGDI